MCSVTGVFAVVPAVYSVIWRLLCLSRQITMPCVSQVTGDGRRLMARATACELAGQTITIDAALQLRDQNRRRGASKPDFRCVECDEPVRAHKGSDYGQAHFEHLSRNSTCRLSDAGR